MAVLLGTMELCDDIEFIQYVIAQDSIGPNKVFVLNTDESDQTLETMYPDKCQCATLLCPPPVAVYKEIDGDRNGFVAEYLKYLSEPSVEEFIAVMLACMHQGRSLLISVTDYSEDSIWLNILRGYFEERFGIHIGTSENDLPFCNPAFGDRVIEFMYSYGVVDVFDFMMCESKQIPMDFSIDLINKLRSDLSPFAVNGQDPLELYGIIKTNQMMTGNPIIKPAISYVPGGGIC